MNTSMDSLANGNTRMYSSTFCKLLEATIKDTLPGFPDIKCEA